MPIPAASPSRNNHLLLRLPPRLRLEAECELVQLRAGEPLGDFGQPRRELYFPGGCLISLMAGGADAGTLELALVGDEGMLGLSVLLGGGPPPWQAVVRGAGSAWRMPATRFRRLLGGQPRWQRQLLGYAGAVLAELAQAVVCASAHPIEARLARWLLTADDRNQGQSLLQTHAMLASVLGVRRSGITAAAGDLQRRQLIRYRRGQIHILDRPGLEQAACHCYRRAH
jgi:CRP-like cAMP-binding protein